MHHKAKQREYIADRSLLQVAVPPNHDGCHGRTPYASLMGALLCVIGVIMFTVMMTSSFNTAIEQARRALKVDKVPMIDRVQIALYAIAAIMALAAFFLLLVGFLNTGSTREELYGTEQSRNGGRVISAIALALSYFLSIVWIAIITFTSILIFVYFIFSDLCKSLPAYSESDCLDFGLFRPIVGDASRSDLKFCGGDVQQFCALTSTAITWFIVSHVGGFIVVIGLLQFIACHAANYAHVTNNKRYLELKGVIYAEDGYDPNPVRHPTSAAIRPQEPRPRMARPLPERNFRGY